EKVILLSELDDDRSVSLDALVNVLKPKSSIKDTPHPTCFFEYGYSLIAKLEATGKAGNSIVYSCAVNKFKSHIKKPRLEFKDITYKVLSEFSDAMLVEGIKINTVSVYMRTIRAIYNKAIKEGIADYAAYPFNSYKIKNEKTLSRTLTVKELKSIVDLTLDVNSASWHWRNVFMLSFYMIGMNLADLLTINESAIVDGRVVFRRKKTGKIYSIKIQKPAQDILYYYRAGMVDKKDDYVLPMIKSGLKPMEQRKAILQSVHTCNNYLKKLAQQCNIGKPVSTYYARYSWANIARRIGYSKDIIAEALGHEYGNRVTGIYLDSYDTEIIDDVNTKVIEAVLTKKGAL
ncbi:MAG: site-specific integrase, partial [Chitinophagaceae bacterium]|nr:site-specific integrase [Chitinophagaceae bacterium]